MSLHGDHSPNLQQPPASKNALQPLDVAPPKESEFLVQEALKKIMFREYAKTLGVDMRGKMIDHQLMKTLQERLQMSLQDALINSLIPDPNAPKAIEVEAPEYGNIIR